jgi:hypothetical protein
MSWKKGGWEPKSKAQLNRDKVKAVAARKAQAAMEKKAAKMKVKNKWWYNI